MTAQLRNLYRALLPERVRFFIWRSLVKIKHFGTTHFCVVCNSHIRHFSPGGVDSDLSRSVEIIGGGIRANVFCPVCRSIDRERLLVRFFKQNSKLMSGNVLHIAPEPNLRTLFLRHATEYIAGDLNPQKGDQKLDIESLPFENDKFDLIVCNHVLEHVYELSKARSELFRVLAPGSSAILQVPFAPSLESSREDTNLPSNEDRLREFGQIDHVRLFGRDYPKIMEAGGFVANPTVPLKDDTHEAVRLGLNQAEPIFLFEKPA